MKIAYDDQTYYNKLQRFKGYQTLIVDDKAGDLMPETLKLVREFFVSLLNRHSLNYAAEAINVDVFEFLTESKLYQSEIDFVFKEEEKNLDPSNMHNLFSMKMSDMTGYEYQKFIKLLNTPKAI